MKRHFGEIGKMPGIFSGSRRIHPMKVPSRTILLNSENVPAAQSAPDGSLAPKVTTRTSQNNAPNGEKLVS